MRAWLPPVVCGGLLAALAMPGPFGSMAGGFGRAAQAQEATPPSAAQAPRTERSKSMRPIRVRPDAANAPAGQSGGSFWQAGATGDFWTDREIWRTFPTHDFSMPGGPRPSNEGERAPRP